MPPPVTLVALSISSKVSAGKGWKASKWTRSPVRVQASRNSPMSGKPSKPSQSFCRAKIARALARHDFCVLVLTAAFFK
jgi:hypothetical protein